MKILLFIILLIIIPTQISAFQYRDVVLIRTAFLNGFEAALKMDIEILKTLKKQNIKAINVANTIANKYVKIVESMN